MKHSGIHIQLMLSATLAWAMSAGACSFAGSLEINPTSDLVVYYADSIYFKSIAVWAFIVSSLFYRYLNYWEVTGLAAVVSFIAYLCAGNMVDEFLIEDPWFTTANEYLFAILGGISALFEYLNFHPIKNVLKHYVRN